MSFFYLDLEIPRKEKNNPKHPWERIIKDTYTGTYKYGHNSANNPVYPPPKKVRVPCPNRVKFTVIGTRTAKEFIYCMKLVQGLHKYRWKHFDAPIITAVTSADWPKVWKELKLQYGGEAYCLESQVAVLIDDKFLGGEKELKELIDKKYIYYIKPDYYSEAINLFSNYLKSSGRPCAYFEITVDGEDIGMLIFMLYSDILPQTCENFLRLCKTKKGGYSGTPIHRIVKDSWIQCGGYGLKETDLSCENFIVPHDRRGVLGMANDGRHVDCSTQFFVLLQPQNWMAFKYVAFGQLISGEDTLKKIEQVPIWYESPKQKVMIASAGILNLECQDIVINKGTYTYLEGHIENLTIIGDMFYEELLEKVFLETQYRSLQRIEAEMVVGETEITPEEAAKNLRTTQRFMRKKEEIDKQLEKSGDRSGKSTPAVTDKGENDDFDVEEYAYVPEEYSYQQVSAVASGSLEVKPEKPFYIPLTDVIYPGEVSSEYDFKRLLQGHYCLESDLDKEVGKTKVDGKTKTDENKPFFKPEILKEIVRTSEHIDSSEDLDTDDEEEIKRYLEDNTDTASFAGEIVRAMAKTGKFKFDAKGFGLVPDEALRKYRKAEWEFRRAHEKRVSISIPEAEASEIHKEVIRRPTGFIRPEDLVRMRQMERMDDDDFSEDDAELDDYLPYTRQVSVQHPHSFTSYKKMVAEQKSAALRRDTTQTIDGLLTSEGVLVEEDIEERQDPSQVFRKGGIIVKDVKAVRKEQKSRGVVAWKTISDFHTGKRVSGFDEERRPSVLTRLIDEVATDQDPGPTLKDYRPLEEQQQKNPLFLVTVSSERFLRNVSENSREIYLQRRHSIEMPHDRNYKPIDQILLLQHGKKVYRKISTDYVKTIDQIEQKEETSLRTLEYAKYRPAISVKDYQRKNREYLENLAKSKTVKEKTSKVKQKQSKESTSRSRDKMNSQG